MAVDAETGAATGPYPEPHIPTPAVFKVEYHVSFTATVEASPLAIMLYNEYRVATTRSNNPQIDLQERVRHANDARVHFDALAVLLRDKITREHGDPKVMDAALISE
jgi:hypothetical protein